VREQVQERERSREGGTRREEVCRRARAREIEIEIDKGTTNEKEKKNMREGKTERDYTSAGACARVRALAESE